jgi:hypothetical protein
MIECVAQRINNLFGVRLGNPLQKCRDREPGPQSFPLLKWQPRLRPNLANVNETARVLGGKERRPV